MIIVYSLSGILLSFGLYKICLPSGRIATAIRNIHGRRDMSKYLQDALMPAARLITKLFPMSEYRIKRMEADFSRLHMDQSPQDFIGIAIAKSLLLALIGLLFVALGIMWIVLITCVLAILAYFQSVQDIRKRVEAQNREIETELPRLVETLNYHLEDNRDLISFFEKYRSVAGKVLVKELDRLILDMKTGNHEAALRKMDARLGLPSFSALCFILCGVHQGVDQHVSLLVLEQDLRTKERETFRRLMEKRPGRIKAASFILTVVMILMFMVPLIVLIINNLQSTGI